MRFKYIQTEGYFLGSSQRPNFETEKRITYKHLRINKSSCDFLRWLNLTVNKLHYCRHQSDFMGSHHVAAKLIITVKVSRLSHNSLVQIFTKNNNFNQLKGLSPQLRWPSVKTWIFKGCSWVNYDPSTSKCLHFLFAHSLAPEGWPAFQSKQSRLWQGRRAVLLAMAISFQNRFHRKQGRSS